MVEPARHEGNGGSRASLGMYDFPWLRAATDGLWVAIASRLGQHGLVDLPAALDRARPLDAIWRDPALLLAQTCGYPLVTSLAGAVAYVATPIYAAPGCDGPRHRSLVIVRDGDRAQGLADLRGRRAAINGWESNTGMNLLRALVAPLARGGRFFAAVTVTGSHLASVEAVAAGRADAAAIDCVTHALAASHRPDLLAGTRVLARTASTPSLPLVTRPGAPAKEIEAVRSALAEVGADPALAGLRRALLLEGWAVLPSDAYAVVTQYERRAAAAGYAILA